MPEKHRVYLAIDLKSFYASVECVERGLDPLTTNLVVADNSRTEKTICLAVSPSLKAYGIPGRARLFEVIQKVKAINAVRTAKAPNHTLIGSSFDAVSLRKDPSLALDYLVACPKMAHYIRCSTDIFQIYMKYVAPEDIHVYSIDEVFIDATDYLPPGKSPRELAMEMILDVLHTTGITATAGIGTNLYLAKIAMDIMAKHIPPDANGVRIAELDEHSYRQELWSHRPLTDFWRVGRGIAARLEANGLFTMGDIARCSLGAPDTCYNEELLYHLLGVNAELLIDHAWGWEPCRIADIKAYRPESHSISSGQVLSCPYSHEKAGTIVREMADALVLDLVDKDLMTDQLVLTICYDTENLTRPEIRALYSGPVTHDHYGRAVPKNAHGTANLGAFSSSTRRIVEAALALYERITDAALLVRRVYLVANHISPVHTCEALAAAPAFEQLDLFTDYAAREQARADEARQLDREKRRQRAILSIQKKHGQGMLLKGTSLLEGATGKTRSKSIGGHNA